MHLGFSNPDFMNMFFTWFYFLLYLIFISVFVCVCVCFLLLRGVVEYDAEGFTKLTLLLMWKDFCFLVHSEYTFAISMSACI